MPARKNRYPSSTILRLTSCFLLISLYLTKPAIAQVVLIEDYFNEIDVTGTPVGWEEVRNPNKWEVVNSEYIATVPPGNFNDHAVSIRGDSEWTNYSFEVDIKGISGPDRSIVFRYDENRSRRGYRIKYFENDYFRSDLHILGINPVNCVLDKDDYSSRNGEWHRVKVIGINNNIKVYFDGDLKLDCYDPNPIPKGKPGLYVQTSGSIDPNTGRLAVNKVAYDNVVVKSIESPAPPTQKVVVIPGLGGSWNTEDILRCEIEDNNDGWGLSPIIAYDVYNPLMDRLGDERWEVYPYYYDWRRNVKDNSDFLDSFIENIDGLESNEKVHVVGHSMGGLIGRAYIEEKTEEENRVEKLLTAGSPHKGVATAYPAWSAGKIWNENFLMKIAITTLVKHCGLKGKYKSDRETLRSIAPSLQDLLPTYEFLKDKKTYILKPLEDMEAQNNWLLNSIFNPPFNGTELGTLSGNGFKTLDKIKYKNRNRRDEKLGNWVDGKPAGKEFSLEGDGTVLSMSSNLDDAAFQESIKKDHLNIIASNEGVEKILEFLGPYPFILSSSETSSFIEPESALLIIGHPADFIVNDPKGKIKKDKDGVVVFLNPKKGKYLLSLVPESKDSLLIVGQFLKNGRVLWKEYELKNKFPKVKTINFEPDNPSEDPVF